MIAYLTYKSIHLSGIFLLLMGCAGYAIQSSAAGVAGWRKPVAITHGVGLLLALLGGFGMLARMHIHWPWPWWVIVKLLVWISLGAIIALMKRKPSAAKSLWFATLALALTALLVVLYK